jgi:hypothetical protein
MQWVVHWLALNQFYFRALQPGHNDSVGSAANSLTRLTGESIEVKTFNIFEFLIMVEPHSMN